MLFVGSDSHGPSQSQFPVPKLIPWKMPFSGLPEDPEGVGLSNVTVTVVLVAAWPFPWAKRQRHRAQALTHPSLACFNRRLLSRKLLFAPGSAEPDGSIRMNAWF